LKNRYSGDNQPEKLKSIIDSLEKDLYILKQNNDNISKVSKHNETRTLQLEGDIKDFMKGINQELKNIITWVDNYLVNSFEKNTDIPDPSSTTSQFIKNNTYIESLKGSLIAVRKGVSNESTKSDVVIRELRKENGNLHMKNESLGKEASSLKNEVLEKIDEIYRLNQELQKYANEITCVQKQEYKVKNEFYDKIEQYNKFVDKIHDKLKLAMNESMKTLNCRS
jgi:chromosome segregation ATPase